MLGQILGQKRSIIARMILKPSMLRLFQKFMISLLGTASKISLNTQYLPVYPVLVASKYPLTFQAILACHPHCSSWGVTEKRIQQYTTPKE